MNYPSMRKLKHDLTEKKLGRWTIIKRLPSKGKGPLWQCRCECGNEKLVRTQPLISGDSKSCGCLNLEKTSERIRVRATTHGMTKTRFYRTWRSIKERCYLPSQVSYKRYGGKGITMCKRWHTFENFRDDMYQSYQSHVKKHGERQTQIDRIDPTKNYTPKNCRWVTIREQQSNRSTTRFITYNDDTLSLKQWSEKLGMNYGMLSLRLNRRKWSVEKAFSTPSLRG